MKQKLLTVVKRLFNKPTSKHSVAVEPAERKVYTALFETMHEHALIYVAPAGLKTTYQSMILDINPEEKYLLIDELFPHTGYEVAVGDRLSVSIGRKGKALTFPTELLMTGEHNGAPFFKVTLPTVIQQEQRRKAYRVDLELREQNYVRCQLRNGQQWAGYLKDISLSGIRVELYDEQQGIEPGMLLHGVRINIGSELEFKCDLEVMNIGRRAAGQQGSALGAQYVSMSDADERQLQQYLLKLQRKMIKREVSATG